MTTLLIKLVNGDEIIGDVNDSTISNIIEITNPLIIENRTTGGSIAFVLNKYLSFSDSNYITMNPGNIIAMTTVSNDMEEYWKANVEYINKNMVPAMEMNIKRGLSYFKSESLDEDNEITDDEESEMTDEEFMEELLREIEPPSKLKH